MQDQGALSQAEQDDALDQKIQLTADRIDIRAPHFILWLRSSRPELFEKGEDIRTTIDLSLQTEIEKIIANKLSLLQEKNVTSAAAVVLDAKNGDILAMIGSADYFDAQHDGAVNVALAPRQPGSSVKPFTYALALQDDWTAATTVADVESRFWTQEGNPYTPRNYDFGYHGLVKLREALANSYNIAAVKVLEHVGVGRLLSFMREAGISTLSQDPQHYGLALTLGDAEVRLIDLAQAYAIFPRGGATLGTRSVLADPVEKGRRILNPSAAWLITDILSDDQARIAEFGEGGALSFDFPVAAKTGTTRNSRDNWTVGFTPDRIVGVWVGNADNSPMRDTSGITGAGPIFHDAMLAASAHTSKAGFARPADIVELDVCKLSGKLPTAYCPHTIREKFIEGTEPKQSDDIYREVSIDTRSGLLGEGCESRYTRREVFAFFPPELRKWARENGWKEAPAIRSPLCGTSGDSPVSSANLTITRPSNGDTFRLDPMIPDAQENIILEARAADGTHSAQWLIDGKIIGTGQAPDFRMQWHPPKEGKYQLSVRSGNLENEMFVNVER